MGKLQFHRKVEKDSKQKDKTFSQRINNRNIYLLETQAIQEIERTAKETLQKVQATKSIR